MDEGVPRFCGELYSISTGGMLLVMAVKGCCGSHSVGQLLSVAGESVSSVSQSKAGQVV